MPLSRKGEGCFKQLFLERQSREVKHYKQKRLGEKAGMEAEKPAFERAVLKPSLGV